MKTSKTKLVIFVILILISLTACESDSQSMLKVGAIASLTGEDAYFGDNIQKGMLLANKDSKIKLIVEDFGGDSTKAATAVNKLVNVDKVDILLTEFSEDTLAILSIAEQNKMPVICVACGEIGITAKSDYLFRVWPSDEIEVLSLVNYAEEEFKKAAVLQTISVWENSLTDSFKDHWPGEIIVEKASRDDMDFKTQLLKIKEFDPDFIYLAVYEQRYPVILKQLRELDINASIATTSWINDPSILETCGINCDELIVPQYKKPSEKFVLNFQIEYDEEPGIGADVAYDAVAIIKKLTKQNLLDQLKNTNYSGASGQTEFDSTGDRKSREVLLYQVKAGQLFNFR